MNPILVSVLSRTRLSMRYGLGSLLSVLFLLFFLNTALAAPPPDKGNGNPGGGKKGLSTIKLKDWGEIQVRRVLQTFAFGGLVSDAQITAWAAMKPQRAIVEMLSFDAVNDKLSPPEAGDDNALHCGSLEDLQDFWSANDPGNIMKYSDRYRYATLNSRLNLSTSNLQRTWVKAINTRGCNPFLHKMALYLTNYHASISVHKTRAGLIRDYYDRILQALVDGADFIEIMRVAASSAAVSRAYGHQYNRFSSNGVFYGNDDFAREFFQLFFRILGTTEDPEYHEDTTIEHNAWLLTGMNLDKALNAYGSSNSGDWYVGPLDFSDHTDNTGRNILNLSSHYDSDLGSGSCLEILHATICGATANEKIAGLVSVAAAHPESLDNVPVTIVDFFADDNLDQGEIADIRAAWEDANYDILHFVRAYAISTAFHSDTTFKYKTAFDRNLSIQNANVLTNEETFAREYYDSPYARMATQGAEVFEPAHDVFGGQTGLQAANNRYIFKNAYWQNVAGPNFLADTSDTYTLDGVTELRWEKDWGAVIPLNGDGEHVVGEVASWLWNRFIADGGQNFDPIARAQVQALLAHGRDFSYSVDPDNPEAVFSSADITSGSAAATDQANAAVLMDFSTITANQRVGMAVNFITMTPYAFVMGGQ